MTSSSHLPQQSLHNNGVDDSLKDEMQELSDMSDEESDKEPELEDDV